VAAAAAVSRVLAAGSSRELEAWSAGEGAVAPRCHRPQELQAGCRATARGCGGGNVEGTEGWKKRNSSKLGPAGQKHKSTDKSRKFVEEDNERET